MTLQKRNELKKEYRAIQAEIMAWNDQKPSRRMHNITDYNRLVADWKETRDALAEMAQLCIDEVKAA